MYRRYYGINMGAYIGVVSFVTTVAAGIIMQLIFGSIHAIPIPNVNIKHDLVLFTISYTFWLNMIFGAVALYLWHLNKKHPMKHGCPAHSGHDH